MSIWVYDSNWCNLVYYANNVNSCLLALLIIVNVLKKKYSQLPLYSNFQILICSQTLFEQ